MKKKSKPILVKNFISYIFLLTFILKKLRVIEIFAKNEGTILRTPSLRVSEFLMNAPSF